MEERLIKSFARNSVIAMIIVIVTAVNLSSYNYSVIYASDKDNNRANIYTYDIRENGDLGFKQTDVNFLESELSNNQDAVDNEEIHIPGLSEEYLAIPKHGENTIDDISILDCYMTRSVKISISGAELSFFMENPIIRRVNGQADVDYLDEEHSNKTAIIEVAFDRLYTFNLKEGEKYYYIELLDPEFQYDKIVVIDAGHGGTAVGTSSIDGKYYEKDINLNIVLYLKELLDKEEDIKVYYTRIKDDKYLLDPRVSLANELDADVFISVHCNGDTITQSNGFEILYGGASEKVMKESKELATICLNEIMKKVNMRNRGILESNSRVYILRNSTVPAALIEAGFMTNSNDIKMLTDKKYQKNVAEGIYKAILEICK